MVSSPSGVRKRVLVNFELEKNDSGDDEFDIFAIFIFSHFHKAMYQLSSYIMIVLAPIINHFLIGN